MNKRQKKKLDAKLIIAIRDLNNDVALAENFQPITEEAIRETLKRVKQTKRSIHQTLESHAQLKQMEKDIDRIFEQSRSQFKKYYKEQVLDLGY